MSLTVARRSCWQGRPGRAADIATVCATCENCRHGRGLRVVSRRRRLQNRVLRVQRGPRRRLQWALRQYPVAEGAALSPRGGGRAPAHGWRRLMVLRHHSSRRWLWWRALSQRQHRALTSMSPVLTRLGRSSAQHRQRAVSWSGACAGVTLPSGVVAVVAAPGAASPFTLNLCGAAASESLRVLAQAPMPGESDQRGRAQMHSASPAAAEEIEKAR